MKVTCLICKGTGKYRRPYERFARVCECMIKTLPVDTTLMLVLGGKDTHDQTKETKVIAHAKANERDTASVHISQSYLSELGFVTFTTTEAKLVGKSLIAAAERIEQVAS